MTGCWNARFEDVRPVRDFPSYKGQRNFPGLYFAACTADMSGFESWLERDHTMLLDFSPHLRAFAAQPFWLLWPLGGRVRRHVPDIFVRLAGGGGVVVDVRADDRIGPKDAAAFEATAAACESGSGTVLEELHARDRVISRLGPSVASCEKTTLRG
jgi:hypothetical protein